MKKIILVTLLIIAVTTISALIFYTLKRERIEHCPICPEPSAWSECVDSQQTRTNYRCETTKHICESFTEIKNCQSPEELTIRTVELNEGLEIWKESFENKPDPVTAGLYILGKAMLNQPIIGRDSLIDYLDSQQMPNGGWSGAAYDFTDMFVTHRILLAYFLMDAKPANNMDEFFADFDTWEEVHDYGLTYHDHRDVYHIVFGWALYYHEYPSWIDEFFTEVEKDLSWTVFDEGHGHHKATHILYTYVIARRNFPKLNNLIDSVLGMQEGDGGWSHWNGDKLYGTSIALNLLKTIRVGYSNYRMEEIETAIERSKDFYEKTYTTKMVDSKTAAYFSLDGETFGRWSNLMGIMGSSMNGFINGNFDPTFEGIVEKIH